MSDNNISDSSEITHSEPFGESEISPPASNPELDAQRLKHEKESHDREERLFAYSQKVIEALFVFACIFVTFVLISISKYSASPWLITIASICFLTPAALLVCLLKYTYSKDNDHTELLKELIEKAPVLEFVKNMSEWIQEVIKVKK